jgi:CheY-like chemotaxis protein
MADPGQIEQVLMNLVVNARDAMPDGGKLLIKTSNIILDEWFVARHFGSRPGKFVKISLTDTGIGMDTEVMAHIFEPFFTTKEIGKGTGLGLATVYGIVKQSNGYISVESELGSGTTFEIYLPVVHSEPVAERRQDLSCSGVGSESILLVEDQESLREVIRTQLEQLGYRVFEAASAEPAIALFEEHKVEISLLLTDVVMPGMNGRVLAEKLLEMRPDLRVLFMSGYTDDVVLCGGAPDPSPAILVKPFPRERLASRVRDVLDGRSRAPTI